MKKKKNLYNLQYWLELQSAIIVRWLKEMGNESTLVAALSFSPLSWLLLSLVKSPEAGPFSPILA